MSTVAIKNLFDTLPGGFLITDTSSRVVYANTSVGRRSGFAVPEIIGKKPGELWGGRMQRGFYQSLWKTIGIEKRPFVGAVENRKKNGELVHETLHIAPLKDAAGVVRYFVELRPEFQNERLAEDFENTFVGRASNWDHDGKVWDWVMAILSHGVHQKAAPALYGGDVTALIESEFVLPMQGQLTSRFEDARLIVEAQENPERFSVLYAKYFPKIQSYFVQRMGGNAVVGEDLAQEVFLRAYRYLPSFRVVNASYYTYLLHVAHSVLINYYRKREHPTVSLFEHAELPDECAPVQLAEDRLEMLLVELPLTERNIMLMKYRDGLKVKEIAEKLGKTENAVKLVLSRTRKKLKNKLMA